MTGDNEMLGRKHPIDSIKPSFSSAISLFSTTRTRTMCTGLDGFYAREDGHVASKPAKAGEDGFRDANLFQAIRGVYAVTL